MFGVGRSMFGVRLPTTHQSFTRLRQGFGEAGSGRVTAIPALYSLGYLLLNSFPIRKIPVVRGTFSLAAFDFSVLASEEALLFGFMNIEQLRLLSPNTVDRPTGLSAQS